MAFTTTAEKHTGLGPKIVHNCLTPDTWGEALPERSSFRHVYPADLQARVVRDWAAYGFTAERTA